MNKNIFLKGQHFDVTPSEQQGRAGGRDLFSNYTGSHSEHHEKQRFESLADIPDDLTGFVYPSFSDLIFYLPEGEVGSSQMITVDALDFVETIGTSTYEIHPVRWHRIKTYVRDGRIEYPRIIDDGQIMDGRHRTLMLMKLYGIQKIEAVLVCD